jgi:NADPH-dependent glutamate synthase beta subunit-like oxidoreductase/ferredoxin
MPNVAIHCPVHAAYKELSTLLENAPGLHPRSRRLVEEIATLVRDIASGRAGREHLPAIRQRLSELPSGDADSQEARIAQRFSSLLAEHREVFESHMETHNCASGDCDLLTPAPCQMACPAGIDVPTYVSLIGMGHDAEAIEVIRRDNPFPWVCGLVCTRPCELMCVRGRIDTPVSIKSLKAFAAERALSRGEYRNPQPATPNHRKVCVIGAGPGGLSAAYYLALKGYSVRVIEALPRAGGMLLTGIPRYRLPSDVIDREVAMIQDLGVEFCMGTRFGQDVTLDQLQAEGFEAYFLAVGAHASFKLGIPGEQEFPQVCEAVAFLQGVALGDRRRPGDRVVVIGGGNVAIDAARTCLRLGSRHVTLAYRRTHDEMPADREEVEQAEEEGVHFEFLTIPVAVEGDSGCMTGLRSLRARMVSLPDSDRKSPKPIEDSEFVIAADAVICAIGQRVERHWLGAMDQLAWTRRDTIQVHSATMETNLPGVFAAGDAVTGPATVIEAIGGGKRAADAIDRYLKGIPQPYMPPVPVRRQRVVWTEVPAATKMALKRPEMPLLNIHRRRTTFQQVELGLTENMVREEARRCLRCDICRRCGRCVTVCRDNMGVDALQMGYLDFDRPGNSDFRRTQERCIGCGACATNCPTSAMRLEDRGNERILSLCGTILNRQPLLRCEACGEVIGTQRYLDFIHRRIAAKASALDQKGLCDTCARKKRVHGHSDIKPPA